MWFCFSTRKNFAIRPQSIRMWNRELVVVVAASHHKANILLDLCMHVWLVFGCMLKICGCALPPPEYNKTYKYRKKKTFGKNNNKQ